MNGNRGSPALIGFRIGDPSASFEYIIFLFVDRRGDFDDTASGARIEREGSRRNVAGNRFCRLSESSVSEGNRPIFMQRR